MKKLGLINLLLVLVVSCGDFEFKDSDPSSSRTSTVEGIQGEPGENAESCSVIKFDGGVEIKCPDGTSELIYNGEKGKKGSKGPAGTDGIDITEPIYVGYFCSKTVLRIGNKHYIIHGNLILLEAKWSTISSSCKVRLKNNTVEVSNV